ncbi:hypothetical protein BT69DRAFT_1351594 [Atractiella rhizophila]|nr:hypothetical protein BT69DRAFT_1351594 [Atractiella rhizophila]
MQNTLTTFLSLFTIAAASPYPLPAEQISEILLKRQSNSTSSNSTSSNSTSDNTDSDGVEVDTEGLAISIATIVGAIVLCSLLAWIFGGRAKKPKTPAVSEPTSAPPSKPRKLQTTNPNKDKSSLAPPTPLTRGRPSFTRGHQTKGSGKYNQLPPIQGESGTWTPLEYDGDEDETIFSAGPLSAMPRDGSGAPFAGRGGGMPKSPAAGGPRDRPF